MALIDCSECGKRISDRASACPECGCPVDDIKSLEDSSFTAEMSVLEKPQFHKNDFHRINVENSQYENFEFLDSIDLGRDIVPDKDVYKVKIIEGFDGFESSDFYVDLRKGYIFQDVKDERNRITDMWAYALCHVERVNVFSEDTGKSLFDSSIQRAKVGRSNKHLLAGAAIGLATGGVGGALLGSTAGSLLSANEMDVSVIVYINGIRFGMICPAEVAQYFAQRATFQINSEAIDSHHYYHVDYSWYEFYDRDSWIWIGVFFPPILIYTFFKTQRFSTEDKTTHRYLMLFWGSLYMLVFFIDIMKNN